MQFRLRTTADPSRARIFAEADVLRGLQEEIFDPTDEVLDPATEQWMAIEDHPRFADAAEALEAETEIHVEEATSLDMNPLIDVCLVLLVFFILTTAYVTLEKVLELPKFRAADASSVRQIQAGHVQQHMIVVHLERRNADDVILVEGNEVPPAELVKMLARIATATKKSELLLHVKGVRWGTFVTAVDAAGQAQIKSVNLQIPRAKPVASVLGHPDAELLLASLSVPVRLVQVE